MKPNQLRNEYWLLRHGRSLANEVETIVSKPEHGIDERWTLAQGGEDQARAAGVKFGKVVQAAKRGGRTVRVYSSPFSRTRRTASLAAEAAGLQADMCPIQVAPELRERFFGDELEMQPYRTAYGKIWERDEVSTASVPGGNGESVDEVSARIRHFFERLEDEHKDAVILLVSHGDTLSIMQTTILGEDTKQHRRFAFDTAELRPLIAPGPGSSTLSSRHFHR
ncbi:hypothetical protein VaNZ11_009898 [Volvox africanus]|uniref:Phosphoglycerate mutase n=1 Tax=Volvox africanus TaxID=51714 RepID=A0ABQ5S9U3_9CHLO|nr:hypothetical protein VaNZ11_009898 [Volvox africanus]